MKITDRLIERFLNDECDEIEKQVIRNYFIRRPEMLEKYLTGKTWRDFETKHTLPVQVSEKMLSIIRENTYRKRRSIVIHRGWYMAAALLIAAFGTYWWNTISNTPDVKQVVVKKAATTPKPSYTWQHISNTTPKPISLTLPDSSIVQLSPGSELNYTVPFINNKREIHLKGQAVFHVAKDKSKPFSVHAGKLITTAIGTTFKITAYKENTTKVHLLRGKVRVDADSGLLSKGLKSTFLLPGQELQLNLQEHLLVINKKEKSHHTTALVLTQEKKQKDDSTAIFHNEPLDQLFTTLSEKYQTRISFKPDQLAGMTFTGKFDHRKETLFEFVRTICALNNLGTEEENGMIRIIGQ